MNYATHYERLIARARSRVLSGYVERHHVVPTCIGGTDDLANLVALTPEEHYVAHQLLVKMHPGNHRLIWAAMAMTGKNEFHQRSNKVYGWLRRRFAKEIGERTRGIIRSEESRKKMSEAHIGKKREAHTDATKIKQSLAAKGKRKSDAHRVALSLAKLGKKRGSHSEQHKQRLSESIKKAMAKKGRAKCFDDPGYRAKQAQITKERWAKWKSGEVPRPQFNYSP